MQTKRLFFADTISSVKKINFELKRMKTVYCFLDGSRNHACDLMTSKKLYQLKTLSIPEGLENVIW